ncbi:response regulator [Dorea sp. D27]|uniref:response regulator n=1 Tax=Dorea sp. D27 TaxID=658665 RepID=UPI00067344D2|nr:response regulator [Dorea sp. D27]KMZ53557.1 DNA-binding response regulator [Dorea sp. D27]
MKAIIVDDEKRALNLMASMLSVIEDVELEAEFQSPYEALDYIKTHGEGVDILFLDVEMPGMDGIFMAGELLRLPCPPKIVFVTGYEKYAYAAWEAEAVDYLLKPYRQADVRHAVERCKSFSRAGTAHRIEVKCFPAFELFVDGSPVKFPNKKAKELLAYLIHNKGNWVETGNIVYNIFGEQDEEQGKKYYNVVSYRLRRTLAEEGVSGLMEVEYGKCRVRTECFICDYYRYLDGREELFDGDYMQQYSWAEPTVATLVSRKEKVNKVRY